MHVNRYGQIRPDMTSRGLGQDTPTSSTYLVAAGPQPVSTSDLQAQLNALQQQSGATADVVSGILASSPSVQTTAGIATAAPTNTTMYVLLALVAAVAVMGAMKS